MAGEKRAYRPIELLCFALLIPACAAAEPLHATNDGAALGRGDAPGSSGSGGAGASDAAPPREAGDDTNGAAGGPTAGSDGSVRDGGDETAAPPAPDAAVASLSYEAESGVTFGNAVTVACPTCSNGQRVSLAADSGFTLSDVVAPAAGTNTLVIYYTNADTKNRSIYVGVNGGDSQMLMAVFPPTGGAGNVSSISVPLKGFNLGSNNTIMFFIDTELGPPDLDRISLATTSVVIDSADACSRSSWKATASVTGGDGGGPGAAIDGDLTTRWANNRPQSGVDWFQVDFGALVKLARITLDDSKTFPNDYPGSYAVYASLDGVIFDAAPFATGDGAVNTTVINFMQRTLRAIKIAQVGTARASNWWQIGELELICYE